MIRIVVAFVYLTWVCPSVIAQDRYRTSEKPQDKKWEVIPEVHWMRSTHRTNFPGGSLIVDYAVFPAFSAGIGVEFSTCHFHHDNGVNLTHLKFLPVFLDTRIYLNSNKLIRPYVTLSPGISFIRYTREDPSGNGSSTLIREHGLYMHSSIGCVFGVNCAIHPLVEIGFTGFHMSGNDLDVNPHGLVFTLGMAF